MKPATEGRVAGVVVWVHWKWRIKARVAAGAMNTAAVTYAVIGGITRLPLATVLGTEPDGSCEPTFQ